MSSEYVPIVFNTLADVLRTMRASTQSAYIRLHMSEPEVEKAGVWN